MSYSMLMVLIHTALELVKRQGSRYRLQQTNGGRGRSTRSKLRVKLPGGTPRTAACRKQCHRDGITWH